MLPASSPDLRALRARLMERLGALKAYFEATSVSVGLKSPFWSAFDALRRNQPLAESFVADLQQLMEFLEHDLAPALSQQAAARPAPVAAPAQPARSIQTPVRISFEKSDSTIGIEDTGELIQPNGNTLPPAAAKAPPSRPAPASPPRTAPVVPPNPAPVVAPPPKPPAAVSLERPAEIRLSDIAAAEKVAGPAAVNRAASPRVGDDVPLSKRAAALLVAALDPTSSSGQTPAPALAKPAAAPQSAPAPAAKAVAVAAKPAPAAVKPAAAAPQPVPAAKPVAAVPPPAKPAAAPPQAASVAAPPVAAAPPPATVAAKPAPVAAKPPAPAPQAAPVAAKPVPVAAKPAAPPAAPVAAKPAAAPAQPAVAVSKAVLPAAPAKPALSGKAPMQLPPVRGPAKPPMPEFDQSDVSEPDMSPSQFFRVLDAKLDK